MDNIKLKTSLNRFFEKVRLESFDEYDVKMLLIDIREFIREQTFLREVADSIAHPERNQGICHKAIDSRYARMKMARLGARELAEKKEFDNNADKPESYFSDKILDYINPRKINKTDFDLFVRNSLEDIDESLFIKYYKLKRKEIQNLINNSYQKKNGVYELKASITGRKFQLLEDILKFLRGTITPKGVVTSDALRNDLKNALNRINKLSGFNLSIKEIEKSMECIIVCILALLHDCKFLMYDGTESKAFLSIHGEVVDETTVPITFGDYNLVLMINADNFKFPIITTDINQSAFIDNLVEPDTLHLQPIPWIQTRRDKTNLKLIELSA
ncbi:hypothetical protein [Marivirga arenosa]|uniref:Uncharacterized protein n=1 Tax=Marivirga arenosa TaxID=3059076 RepID=A0AA51ZWM8_9BACT|nr:hypothetical protein [Marivirga sp. BKB1-2]WNB18104.1 hypothetical protein QYS47_29240 [Marivirga sp. BKB1-2]